ncbi:MAG: MATE family efflux transporter [Rhodomicrobium sp.]|nr:MATE family efflux transporter [Rhodomicrobium sp.]
MRMLIAEAQALVRLAVPIVIGLAASTLLGITDTLMLAPLGETVLAAAALTSSALIIFYAGIYGALSVIGVAIGHAYGARDDALVSRQTKTGLWFGAALGIAAALAMSAARFALPWLGQPEDVLAALPEYWAAMLILLLPFALLIALKQMYDAVGKPWLGVAFSFLGVALNIPLNYVLIYGLGPIPALGLTGAGIASLVAESAAFLAGWLYWRRARSMARLRQPTDAVLSDVRRMMSDGAPLGVMYAAETGAYALTGLMLGWFGATALAAHQVVGSVGIVLYMLPLGMAAAVSIRIAQAAGQGRSDDVRPIAIAAFALVTLWTGLSTVFLVAAGSTIAEAIAGDGAIAALAASMFITTAAMQILDGLQSTALGALRGIRDFRFPAALSIVVYWLIALPVAYLVAFPLGFGPAGLWAGFGIGLAIAAVVLLLRFARLTRQTSSIAAPTRDAQIA